jgi:putative transposase
LALARLHRKVKNLRQDFLHKLATWLARTKPVVVVEGLNVKGLSRGPLSRSVADVGWGTFLRMLEYKAKWYGATLIVAPRSFPSTRLCSRCGHLHGKIPLSQRVFRCQACGLEMDRDLNAALNLKAYGLAHLTGPTASSAGSHACGDSSGGGTALLSRSTSYGSWKQEVAHRHHSVEG